MAEEISFDLFESSTSYDEESTSIVPEKPVEMTSISWNDKVEPTVSVLPLPSVMDKMKKVKKQYNIMYFTLGEVKCNKETNEYNICMGMRDIPKADEITEGFINRFLKEQNIITHEMKIDRLNIPYNFPLDLSYINKYFKKLHFKNGFLKNIENLHDDVEEIFMDCRCDDRYTNNMYNGNFDNLPINLKKLEIESNGKTLDFNNLPINLKVFKHYFQGSIFNFNYDNLPNSIEEIVIEQLIDWYSKSSNDVMDLLDFRHHKYGEGGITDRVRNILQEEYGSVNTNTISKFYERYRNNEPKIKELKQQMEDEIKEEYYEYRRSMRRTYNFNRLPKSLKKMSVSSNKVLENFNFPGSMEYWQNFDNDFELECYDLITIGTANSNCLKFIISRSMILQTYRKHLVMHAKELSNFYIHQTYLPGLSLGD